MKYLRLALLMALAGCATNSTDPAANARGRAANQALSEAGRVLGSIAVSTLFNVAQQEAAGNKADYASAASAGLWSNAQSIVSSGAIERIINAYSAKRLPATAAVAANVFTSASGSNTQAASAIAAVISTAAGFPPAK